MRRKPLTHLSHLHKQLSQGYTVSDLSQRFQQNGWSPVSPQHCAGESGLNRTWARTHAFQTSLCSPCPQVWPQAATGLHSSLPLLREDPHLERCCLEKSFFPAPSAHRKGQNEPLNEQTPVCRRGWRKTAFPPLEPHLGADNMHPPAWGLPGSFSRALGPLPHTWQTPAKPQGRTNAACLPQDKASCTQLAEARAGLRPFPSAKPAVFRAEIKRAL